MRKNSKKDAIIYEKYIRSRIQQGVSNISKLYQEMKEKGYIASYSTFYRYINLLPSPHTISKRSIRVDTAPGNQAQVDWGSFGEITISGKIRRLYAFVYVLGYSRMLYAEFVTRQNVQTLQECHIHAFQKLGIPETIVYDNMKTVVLKREKDITKTYTNIYFNPSFSNFAQYYGFNIYACHPYWPREKGKVEAGVKYLRNNFMQGRKFKKDYFNLEELNAQLEGWLKNIANNRVHGTTQEKPYKRWLYEKSYLRFPTGYPVYRTTPFEVRYTTKDGTIQYHSNWYEVPFEYARRKVFVTQLNNNGVPLIDIYHEDTIIARYYVESDRRQWIRLEKSLIAFQGKNHEQNLQAKKKQKQKTKFSYPVISLAQRPIDYYNRFLA